MNNEKANSERNYTLFFFEIVFSLLVVFVHFSYSNIIVGSYLKAYGRSTVIFFFLVSGFFSYNKMSSQTFKDKYKFAKKKIIRLLIYFAITFAVYFLVELLFSQIGSEKTTISDFLNKNFSLKTLGEFLLFNKTPLAGHLWFIMALIYCYLTIPLLEKLISGHSIIFTVISAAVLIVSCLLGYLTDIQISTWYLIGIPSFILGYVFKRSEDNITLFFRKQNNFQTLLSFAFLIALIWFERFVHSFFADYEAIIKTPFLFSSSLLAIYAFCFSVAKPQIIDSTLLKMIPKTVPTYVYLFHVIIIQILSKVVFLFTDGTLASLIVIISTFLVIGFFIFSYSLIKTQLGKRDRQ